MAESAEEGEAWSLTQKVGVLLKNKKTDEREIRKKKVGAGRAKAPKGHLTQRHLPGPGLAEKERGEHEKKEASMKTMKREPPRSQRSSSGKKGVAPCGVLNAKKGKGTTEQNNRGGRKKKG